MTEIKSKSAPAPRAHGRFERWLDLVMANAALKSREQASPPRAFLPKEDDDVNDAAD